MTAAPTTSTTVPAYREQQVWTPLVPGRSGAVLYGLSFGGEVVRVDVDAGVVTYRLLRGPRGERPFGFSVLGRRGAAVLSGPGATGVLVVPDGPTGRPRWWSLAGSPFDRGRVLPAATPDELWLVTTAAGGVTARRVDVEGRPAGDPVAVPDGAVVLGDDGTGTLLVRQGEGTWLLTPTGPERVAGPDLVAWSATRLVERRCAEGCTLVVVDRAGGTGRAVPDALEPASSAAVSPDGAWLAAVTVDGRLVAVDLRDGTARPLAADVADRWGFGTTAGGVWWSGDRVFWLGADGVPRTWRPGDPAAAVVDGRGHVPPLAALSVAPPGG